MGSSAVDRSREVGQRSREGPARAYWTSCSPALRLATRQLRLPADQPNRRHRPFPAPKAQQDLRETRPVLASLIKVCWSRRPSAEIPRSRSASRIASSVQRTSAPPGAAEALPFDRRAEGAKAGASAPRREQSPARSLPSFLLLVRGGSELGASRDALMSRKAGALGRAAHAVARSWLVADPTLPRQPLLGDSRSDCRAQASG